MDQQQDIIDLIKAHPPFSRRMILPRGVIMAAVTRTRGRDLHASMELPLHVRTLHPIRALQEGIGDEGERGCISGWSPLPTLPCCRFIHWLEKHRHGNARFTASSAAAMALFVPGRLVGPLGISREKKYRKSGHKKGRNSPHS